MTHNSANLFIFFLTAECISQTSGLDPCQISSSYVKSLRHRAVQKKKDNTAFTLRWPLSLLTL